GSARAGAGFPGGRRRADVNQPAVAARRRPGGGVRPGGRSRPGGPGRTGRAAAPGRAGDHPAGPVAGTGSGRGPHHRGPAGRPGLSSGGGAGGPAGEGPLAADPAALALAHAAPDAELLTVLERVLEALLAHDAAAADLLGLPGGRASLREEQVGVDAQTVRVVLPALGLGVDVGRDGDPHVYPSVT